MRSVAGEPARPPAVDEEQFAVRTETWKYLFTGSGEELYHVESDPAEMHDVARDHPTELDELRQSLRQWLAKHPLQRAPSAPIDEGLTETLRALGYDR